MKLKKGKHKKPVAKSGKEEAEISIRRNQSRLVKVDFKQKGFFDFFYLNVQYYNRKVLVNKVTYLEKYKKYKSEKRQHPSPERAEGCGTCQNLLKALVFL